MKTIYVKKTGRNVRIEGYAFPYPIQTDNSSTFIEFAYVTPESAKKIISFHCLPIENYVNLLNKFLIQKMIMRVECVRDCGLRIVEISNLDYHLVTRGKRLKTSDKNSYKFASFSNGILHAIWKKCDTVLINDWSLLEYILKRSYGNFGFKRNKTSCLGMNLYFGKKNAAYVRPTPKMSKESILDTEYYRQHFDCTFHPLIYKMINELTTQAEHFQKCFDPIYDRFLFNSLRSKNENDNKHEKRIDDLTTKKIMNHCRFCALSILTCGNSIIRGFANQPHKDNDYITSHCHHYCLNNLKKIYHESKECDNEFIGVALHHIKKRYEKNNRFSTYTTCGYKCKFDPKDTKNIKQYLAFFIYNDFNIAVTIPEDSCYHTFDASFCQHHTSVPITLDNNYVYFNDKDLFVFAWGGGKSEKKRWVQRTEFEDSKLTRNSEINSFFKSI